MITFVDKNNNFNGSLHSFFRKAKKSPLSVIKYPTHTGIRKKTSIEMPMPDSTRIYLKDELLADRQTYMKNQRKLQEKKETIKFYIEATILSALLLAVPILVLSRRTNAISSVMEQSATFEQTKGFKQTTLYIIGKAGEPFDKSFRFIEEKCSRIKKKLQQKIDIDLYGKDAKIKKEVEKNDELKPLFNLDL